MAAIKVGVREFRERIASFMESNSPVAVTRRGETVGVYVPTPRAGKVESSDLKAAANRLALALKHVDEEEVAAEFDRVRRGTKAKPRRK